MAGAEDRPTSVALNVGSFTQQRDPSGRFTGLSGRSVIAGRFEVESPLGRGGMSEVWLALDKRLGRRVALKLHGGYLDAARFEQEARSAASLSHPNVAGIYDYGEFDGQPYLVLEYLKGGTLEQRLAWGEPLHPAEVERVARDIAAGLAHAHARGIVHRDLKPSNVLFDEDGTAKLADFGIASLTHDGSTANAEAIFGTPAYMSPEQAAGMPARPVSDVYSFGVILFQLLTGDLPFRADLGQALLDPSLRDAPPTVRSRRSNAPEAFALLADAALAKDMSARPANGAALLSVLSVRARAHSQSSAQSAVLAPPSRWRRGLVVVLSLVAAGAGGLALGLTLPLKTDHPRSEAPGVTLRTPVETRRAPPTSSDAPTSPTPTGGAASDATSHNPSEPGGAPRGTNAATTSETTPEATAPTPTETTPTETTPTETTPTETTPTETAPTTPTTTETTPSTTD